MERKNEPVLAPWLPSGGIDVALVIALDVSSSVTLDEFNLMREGLAWAIDSTEVALAIRSGSHGRIAVSVMQWSGFLEQDVASDWVPVQSRANLSELAQQIRTSRRRYDNGATDIGGAIMYSQKMIFMGPLEATRFVIDLVGDGANNVNLPPRFDSDLAAQAGITINCLAIPNKDINLVAYFQEQVIAGPAAFVESTPNFEGFAAAMKRKLVREITSLFS